MKVGDMIKFGKNVGLDLTGILVGHGNFAEGWWDILDSDGKLVVWPETQIEVVNESR